MLKAVIFDMDGVIVDTEPFHARVAVKTGELCGLPIRFSDCYRFIGSTASVMYGAFIKESGSSLSLEEVLATDRRVKRDMLKEEGYHPIPGVKELIADLYQNGVRLAIASSSSPEDIEDVAACLGLSSYFDKLISGAFLPHPKPAPDIFLHALKELSVSAAEAVIIEDSANGVKAAAAAGIAAIGFLNPNSGEQDLSSASVLTDSLEHINCNYVSDVLKRANGEPVTIAVTKRLIIRELAVSDITDMYKIYQDPDVRPYIQDIDGYLEDEIEKHKAYIKNVYGFYGYGLWGIYSRDTKKLIGRCGIENKMVDGKPEIELSYLLDRKYWGMGYALECVGAVLQYAAGVLEMKRIVAVIDRRNTRSVRVAARAGMQPEKQITCRGCDCWLYSVNDLPEVMKRLKAAQKAVPDAPGASVDAVYGRRYDKKGRL